MRNFLIYYSFCFLFCCCQSSDEKTQHDSHLTDSQKAEAREDSLELAKAIADQNKISLSITPDVETQIIKANSAEDAADDPAIWVHPDNPERSLVFGSNKKGGLAAYDLSGSEVSYYPIGNINNVDVLYQFPLGDSLVSVLGCSNRSTQSINLFIINPADGSLKNIAADSLLLDNNLIDDVYGFCFAHDKTSQKNYTIINGKNGMLQQFEMLGSDNGIRLELSRSVKFDSQTEGMVADHETGMLYVGEEGRGIWKLSISPDTGSEKHFLSGSDETNPNIVYDIEGLTLFKKGETGFLIASSQGNFSYAVFELEGENRYVNSFKVSGHQNIDGVEETDGLDVVTDSLSPDFPNGLLVLQDGFNYENEQQVPQNFKFVDLKKLLEILK